MSKPVDVISITPIDDRFAEYRRAATNRILSAYQVPASALRDHATERFGPSMYAAVVAMHHWQRWLGFQPPDR